MTDSHLAPPAIDKYGRRGYKYSKSEVRRARKKRETPMDVEIDANAQQAAAMITWYMEVILILTEVGTILPKYNTPQVQRQRTSP